MTGTLKLKAYSVENQQLGVSIESASNVTKVIDVMIDEMTKDYQLLVLSDDEFERD